MNIDLKKEIQQISTRPDEELLSCFLDGDERCFDELMNRYRDKVYRLALRYVYGDRDTAADMAQQTFIAVYTKGRDYRGEGSFRSWLFSTAVRFSLAELRKQSRSKKHLEHESITLNIQQKNGADYLIDSEARSSAVRDAICRLPDKQRLVLTLRIDAELPFSDIAKVSGMTENSAKVNYHHAVVSLKKLLSKEVAHEMR